LSLSNLETSEAVKIAIRFKPSPRMFEVVLLETFEITEIGEVPISLESDRQHEFLKEFWYVVHQIC
jgi:hypothetical protein